MSATADENPERWFLGELVGTFMLVFFGCGSVATAVSLEIPVGLFQVAIVWGLGLATAIFVTARSSGAHLNPAITIAFALLRGFPRQRVLPYVGAQFLGAFLAAATVYVLFGGAITGFENANGIVRGQPGSEASAMIFGEYFPNPGGKALTADARAAVPLWRGAAAEFLGTALLALAVFGFTAKTNSAGPGRLTPLALGFALTTLICVFAPLSMAGFNPARDLAPRLFSALAGWGSLPFTVNGSGWFLVYILSPIGGALVGAAAAEALHRPTR